MNPILTKRQIQNSIIANIHHFTPIYECSKKEDGESGSFAKEFKNAVETYPYVSDPYVERIPFYRQKSQGKNAISTTLRSMVKDAEALRDREEICCPCIELETAELFAAYFSKAKRREDIDPEKIRLYEHQVRAAEAIAEGKNLIVSTGTGSGKTESFLIPVLNAIITERKNKGDAYKHGVRAMILYPMNALVEDQVRRIRDILRTAERCNIPYAKDITFGKYTGDVDTLQTESYNTSQLKADNKDSYDKLSKMMGGMHSVHTDHPYLSGDVCIKNEYASRSQWETADGAADILITNYAMLERLMLDPGRDGIFTTGTWQFIVLDEAHTYDGGTGTEIAWLMRRLTGRIKQGEEQKLKYIATSATMFSKGEILQAQEFGANLFPTEAKTFSVQEGFRQKPVYDGVEIPEAHFPLSDWEAPDFKVNQDELLSKIDISEFKRLWKKSLSEKERDNINLFALTQWHIQAKEWLGEMGWFRNFVENLGNETYCALGDFVAICRSVEDYAPSCEKNLRLNGAFADFLKQFVVSIKNDGEYIKTVIRQTQDIKEEKEIADSYERLEKIPESGDGYSELPPFDWVTLVTLLCEKCETYTRISDSEKPYEPLMWAVQLSTESLAYLREIKALMDKAEESLLIMENWIVSGWQKALRISQEKTVPQIMQRYLLQYKEFYQLEKALEDKPCSWEDIKGIFANNESAFEVFSGMLMLSQHPELKSKPLMDLRFHQCVKGITSIGVWFEENTDGKVYPHILIDSDGQQHEDARGKIHPVYTLSYCAKCGQPYLSGFVQGNFEQGDEDVYEDNGEAVNFLRYSHQATYNDRSSQETYFAFSWFQGNQEATVLSAEPQELKKNVYWLLYDSGKVCKQSHQPPHSIPLYYDARHVESESTIPTYIVSCPACGGNEGGNKQQKGEYGIITPFRTRETVTRNVALYAMCDNADKHFSLSGAPQGGKKVLAFSDSRAKAASVGVYFESFMKTRVVEEGVLKSITPKCDWNDKILKCIKNMQEAPTDRVRKAYEEDLIDYKQEPNAKTKCYPSLVEVAERLHEHLAKSGALRALRYAYNDEEGIKEFSELNSAVLAALTCLRKAGRNSVLNRNRAAVRPRFLSLNTEKTNWKNWCSLFSDERTAEKIFLEILSILYMRVELECKHIWEEKLEHGPEHYKKAQMISEEDSEESYYINGCENWARELVTFEKKGDGIRITANSNNKIIKHLKNNISDGLNTLSQAVSYLQNLLISGEDKEKLLVKETNAKQYRLNLNAIAYDLPATRDSEDSTVKVDTVYRAEEHTAQIDLAKGKLYQSLFAEGKINVLSCSTTFEMGVDLGSLNSVFLCNLPPSVANYTQRAGRAGRRAGSASHVVTFMGSRPHDKYFRENPKALFFGSCKSPQLYLSNVSYRAKHLRAEALHDFLEFCQSKLRMQEADNWKKSGAFFCGKLTKGAVKYGQTKKREYQPPRIEDASSWIDLLDEWLKDQERINSLQRHCESIAREELKYKVADDLVYQLSDTIKVSFAAELSRELAGPHIEDSALNRPLLPMYREKSDLLHGAEHHHRLIHLYSTSTIDYLAQNRVLPIYGFPCDVIELEPDNEDNCSARLSRDKKIGIFEYAPGKKVLADKRVYESNKPVFYQIRSAITANNQELSDGSKDKKLWRCPDCMQFFETEELPDGGCPLCEGTKSRVPFKFYTPDAFRAKKSQPLVEAIYDDKNYSIRSLYPDKSALETQKPYDIPGSNIRVLVPQKKEIHYLNTNSPWEQHKHDEKGRTLYQNEQGVQKAFYKKEKREEDWKPVIESKYDGIFHTVRTDFLFFTTYSSTEGTQGWELERRLHAWESAAQALVKGAARKLEINERDLDGMVIRNERGQFNILLIDNTSNGSGILLPLMDVYEQGVKGKVSANTKLLRDIFRSAEEVCKCKTCNEHEDNRIPQTHVDYIAMVDEKTETHYREYAACYSCLKGYANQHLHDTLDAHDAAVILRAMLGDEGESTATEAQTQLEESTQESKEQQRAQIQKDGTACPLGKAQHIESSTIPFLKKFRVWNGSEVIEMEWLQKSAGCDNCADMIKVSDKTLIRNVPFANIYPL